MQILAGSDHYLPFIGLAKARGWPLGKTAGVTLACGIGQVISSVALGLLSYGLGASLKALAVAESVRADIAVGLLIAFGLIYAAWGLRRAGRPGAHGHAHSHGGSLQAHDHIHDPRTGETIPLTPWILFVIFIFDPCVALGPLFIYPAATRGWSAALAVAGIFAVATLMAMLSAVAASSLGIERIPLRTWGRYSHAIAGVSLATTGCAMKLFQI